MLFYQAVLPTFTHANMFLKREEPLIHLLKSSLVKLVKKIMATFVLPDDVSCVDYSSRENQLPDGQLVIGYITKQRLALLLEDGLIDQADVNRFYLAARWFLIKAVDYLIKWCPLKDPLLHHSSWIDFRNRHKCSFMSVEFFVDTYTHIFQQIDRDKLNE